MEKKIILSKEVGPSLTQFKPFSIFIATQALYCKYR